MNNTGLRYISAMYTAKEEKHPLLVVLVDTDPEDDLMMGTLGRTGGPDGSGATDKLRAFGTKGRERARSLVTGTVNIIKFWPDHLTIYTLIMSLVVLTIILLVNLCVHMASSPRIDVFGEMELVKETCLKHKKMDLALMTSMYRQPDAFVYIYLNEGRDQLMNVVRRNLTELTRISDKFNVNTVILKNDTAEYVTDHRYKRQKESENLTYVSPRMGFHHYHPRPFSEFFEHSPFENTWFKLPYEIVPFAVMVASLWEYGGLSIDMEKFNRTINEDHVEKNGFGKADEFENPLHVFDDNDFGLDPNYYTHFGNVPVNNIQDIINYETTDAFTPANKRDNETIDVSIVKDNSSALKESFDQVINVTQVWNKSAEISSVHNDNTSIIRNLFGKLVDQKLNDDSDVRNSSEVHTVNMKPNRHSAYSAHRRKRFRWQNRSHRFPFLTLPREDVAMIDKDGLFISVKLPCHAFIGQLIQRMRTKTDYHSAKDVIADALAVFCKRSDKSHGVCEGVEVF